MARQRQDGVRQSSPQPRNRGNANMNLRARDDRWLFPLWRSLDTSFICLEVYNSRGNGSISRPGNSMNVIESVALHYLDTTDLIYLRVNVDLELESEIKR